MTHPYPIRDKLDINFDKTFLDYIKDKPFYVINMKNNEPVPIMGNLRNDGIGDLYFIGDLLDSNNIFKPNSRVSVYYFEMSESIGGFKKKSTQYWVETVINNFESGVWKLVEWVENNFTYSDVVKHLTSVKDFNPFDGLNESKQLEYPINVGTTLYCHTPIDHYEAGAWYRVFDIKYGEGTNGEDIISIYDGKNEYTKEGWWTIQKDVNGLNYENWFSLGDSSFDTHDIFNKLYENINDGIKLEDGTTIVFPFDYTNEDVYKVLNWLTQNGWVKGYPEKDLKDVLHDLDKPWNKGKRRPFLMLRKGGAYSEPTVYWAPTGNVERHSNTFSKVIKAEDLLSSINTDFFITESIDDFNWVEEVISPISNCDETVIVTNRGHTYSSYLNAMAELDVPFASDIVNKIRQKYGVEDVSDNKQKEWNNGMSEDHSKGMYELRFKNVLGDPKNGDICCLYGKKWGHIYRLIRYRDGKTFIMNGRGFEPYNISDKLTENKEWFEDVEDYSKYIRIGQKFSFSPRIDSYSKEGRTVVQIVGFKHNSVVISPINRLSHIGVSFTYKRLIELLSNGDWIVVD